MKNKHIKVIAFDADDTLWDCQGHFERVMQQLYTELLPWTGTREEAARQLFATERKNMQLLGFGTKAFTLSMLETAMRVSHYEMPTAKLNDILQQCYTLNEFPCTPLPEVRETLETLWHCIHKSAEISTLRPTSADLHPLTSIEQLVCFTKGELLDQEHKLERSGLGRYFSHLEITSDKDVPQFLALCRKLSIRPDELLMVGNSLRSDIAPALSIGAWAVYIPFDITWELESTEHFEHERMVQIEHFSQLLDVLQLRI